MEFQLLELTGRLSRISGVPSRLGGTSGVYAVSIVLVACAAALFSQLRQLSVPSALPLPWWLLAVLFFAAELKVVHFQFRRDAHSFSLSEIPLVLGLFFASPTDLLLGQLLGSGAALGIILRQAPAKLTFNLAQYATTTVLALGTFQLLTSHTQGAATPLPGTTDWLGALVATQISNGAGVVLIALAISIVEREAQFDRLMETLQIASVVSLTNTSVALVGITILLRDPGSLWLLLIPIATLFMAYRMYVSERRKHESLQLIYESTRILQRSPEVDSAMVELLGHARRMFRAEVAEITLQPMDGREGTLRTRVGPLDHVELMVPGSAAWSEAIDSFRPVDDDSYLIQEPEPALLPDDGFRLRDAMVATMRGESRAIGTMVVANRLGEVGSFGEDDLRLLETIASQTAVALEKGQLEQSLAQLSQLRDQLTHQAYHDPLTGLGNRQLFVQRVEERLAAQAGAEQQPVVMFLDLDDFKVVNDSMGHAAGDALLAVMSKRVSSCLRDGDMAARLGGDEFAILVDDEAKLEVAVNVARRLLQAVRAPCQIEGRELSISASIGIASSHDAARSAQGLLRNADVAMYTAKARGKGDLAIFESTMHAAFVARHELRGRLEASLAREEFALLYQPIVELATGRIMAAEALLRWRDGGKTVTGPAEFIPLAEETGLIVPLGRWVLREACRQARRWQVAHPDLANLNVAVNLSPRQLTDPMFMEDVLLALAESGLSATNLVLECTENVLIQDSDTTVQRLARLRELGAHVAIDDFGTGYSSLSYLRQFPVDTLKIAREFVSGVGPELDWSFPRAITALGASLGLTVVAEGIETADQLTGLVALGCQFGQGYLFAPPLEAEAFAALAARSSVAPAMRMEVAGAIGG